jgi:hypothetical protein
MSLRWSEQAEASFRRSLLGDLYSWELKPQVDPLRWVVHLRLKRWIRKEEVPFLRSLLSEWCEANDAVYRKSTWKKWDFRALIFIKGLGPVQDNSPFDLL